MTSKLPPEVEEAIDEVLRAVYIRDKEDDTDCGCDGCREIAKAITAACEKAYAAGQGRRDHAVMRAAQLALRIGALREALAELSRDEYAGGIDDMRFVAKNALSVDDDREQAGSA